MIEWIVDCHSHIDEHWLAKDGALLEEVVCRCARYRVAVVVSLDCAQGLAELDPDRLRPLFRRHGVALGMTLGFAPPASPEQLEGLEQRLALALESVRQLSAAEDVVGVGEVGLDYYWPRVNFDRASASSGATRTPASRDEWLRQCHQAQQSVFLRWLELARELSLPVVIHQREAFDDALAVVGASSIRPDRVMFHCFTEGESEARRAAQMGCRLSIPASAMVRGDLDVVRATELASLLVETDSPCLSPMPPLWKAARDEACAGVPSAELDRYKRGRVFEEKLAQRLQAHLDRRLPGLSFGGVPGAPYLSRRKGKRSNEPAFVRLAIEPLARAKALSEPDLCRALLENARVFYSYDFAGATVAEL
jgi:Tat protein secretion system quality control protein TatD with DNase activity